MDKRTMQPLLDEIGRQLSNKKRVLLAIEGRSGSGKTSIAALLQQVYDCNVFHMDDFFLRAEQRTPERYAQAGGNVDYERFCEQVLLPLSRGEAVQYSRLDCASFKLSPPVIVAPKRLNIIEGAYSMHPELAGFYDFSVFLQIDPDTQRERIEKRNGAHAQQFFSTWIPLEEAYFSAFDIAARCDMIIDVIQPEL